MPYFSIIMPVMNRPREVGRAIRSCLEQDCGDFELIVTDDGSTDNTAEVVEGFVRVDARVRLIRHAVNRGVCPARNTAARAATGAWLVQLDSDMSLMPGALSILRRHTLEAADDVGEVATCLRWDTGALSPQPTLPAGDLDFPRYLAWVDSLTVSEWFNCIRREVFEKIRWPESRAYERSFHLGLAQAWKFRIHEEVTAVYHTDAEDSICRPRDWRVAQRRMLCEAGDHAQDAEEILQRHGAALREYAPRQHFAVQYAAALSWFLAGCRRRALGRLRQCIACRPWAPQNWILAGLGLAGRRPLALAYSRMRYHFPGLMDRVRRLGSIATCTRGRIPPVATDDRAGSARQRRTRMPEVRAPEEAPVR